MSQMNLVVLAITGYDHLLSLQIEHARRRLRRWWVRPTIQARLQQGQHESLLQELELRDPDWFFLYTRMNVDQFEWILRKISSDLERKHVMREPLSPKLRLIVTLRHLATGDNYFTLAVCFRIGISTVCGIIAEVCDLLWRKLSPYAFKPLNNDTWSKISEDFLTYWNFPHVCGSIDGKHIRIRAPKKSGTKFHNYKGYFSTVLIAVADAQYRFTCVNIGSFGSNSDGGILKNSHLGRLLRSGNIGFPPPQPLIEGGERIPYYLLGDEAFGLQTWCMVPYSGRYLEEDVEYFNYRLSRARRVVENAFGIYCARWRIFHRTICATPETVDRLVKATLVLHNLLCTSNNHSYASPNFVDRVVNGRSVEGLWRREVSSSRLTDLPSHLRLGSRNAPKDATDIRNYLKDYLFR